MRDYFLVLIFPIFVYYGLRTPIISLYLWFWTSMYPLQNWVYGLALSLRFNLVFSLITMGGYVLMKNKPPFKLTALFVLVMLFLFHSFLGVAFYALHDGMWNSLEEFFKGILFFIFITLLVRKKDHFEGIIYFLTLALCFYGAMEGGKVLLSAGGHKMSGILGPLGDNNKVALGLNMTIPLVLYAISETKVKLIKQFLRVLLFFCVLAILGSASRGGFVALLVLGFVYWWKNGKKLSIIFGFLFMAVVTVNLMPSSWFERMDTLKEAGQENTLISRVTSWKINTLAAMDHPFIGHGFNATAIYIVWRDYAHNLDSLNFFVDTPIPTKGYVAHSIYFEVLGNQGFVGLFIFLLILFLTFSKIKFLQKHHFERGTWQHNLLGSIHVSLVAYCVGGAALSAAYFELLYLLVALVICLQITALEGQRPPSHPSAV
ncbi:putative O-glycosylation ligase, exosortase A system-associated [Alteromonadaceae bacterium BrNp21-10]|nr:putative O-glycosylation ligase, exosortase A system-associated [Alteromonadaceae bacterium BrNp21-10]